MRRIDDAERRNRLGQRHHLAHPASSEEQVASDLVGLHSSDPATVYLSSWARVAGFAVSDMETSLYEERSLLRMLGMRRTMFVVPRDLAAVMQAACTDDLVAAERRRLIGFLEDQDIADEGESWLAQLEEDVLAAMKRRGEATANELKEDVPALSARIAFGEGKSWGGTVGVSTRVLFLLATTGRAVRARPKGSWTSSHYRWTATETWVDGGLPQPDRKHAEEELVRRWLHNYGPGTETDIAWWTGWGVRRTRNVLRRLEAVPVELSRGEGWVLPEDQEPVPSVEPWIALLPSLDSTVMGWKERDWYLGDWAPMLYDRNGNAGPTVWADGRIVGGWAHRGPGDVVFRLLVDVGGETEAAIAAAADELAAWLGVVRVRARFPTPMEKELFA